MDTTHQAADALIKTTKETVEREEQLVQRVQDARKALSLLSETVRAEWLAFAGESDQHLKEFRMWRMAMDGEAGTLLKQFGEVRKFFLASDHAEEMKRLKEFVELCERLKALKECGFLDEVADTMLKLGEVP